MPSTRTRALLIWVAVVACGCAVYCWVSMLMLHVRGALAEDQTRYFEEVREAGLGTNDARQIAKFAEAAIRYYPSGTKQPKGTHLDIIVERARALALDDLARHAAQTTGHDVRTNFHAWIEKYSK